MMVRLALLVLSLWTLLALAANWLPLAPNALRLTHILQGPDASAWLGYDALGRSLLDRLLVGAQTSLLVAVAVITLSASIGTLIGLLSGWYGGSVDRVMVCIIDVFLAFPGILLAIALAGLLGPGIDNVIIALAAVGWVGYARLARAQTLALKQCEHVLAARAMGTGTAGILWQHILPLLLAPLLIEATFGIAAVVVAEAGLSFLGLGVQPPEPSWGTLIRDGARYMLVAPHAVVVPGTAMLLVVLSVNLLGDRLRDHLDVKQP